MRVVIREGEIDPAGIVIGSDASVEAGAPSPHPAGGLRVILTPSADAPEQLWLSLSHRDSPQTVLARAGVATHAPPPPEPEAPPSAWVPYALHETQGLFATPSWVGLRDEQREGHGTWIGIAGASARLGEPDPRVRLVAGVSASLLDEYLRLEAIVPLDVIGQAARSADRGARDVHFAVGHAVLLKGVPSLVLAPGGRVLIDTQGTSDLAVAGMGDTLTGVCGALLAQGASALDAGAVGLYLTGRAARIAGRGVSLTPSDVIRWLPEALLESPSVESALDLPFVIFDAEAPR